MKDRGLCTTRPNDYEHIKRSRVYVAKVSRERPASWLGGEVRRHCVRCEAEIGREDRVCPSCHAQLRKECPDCHYWVDMDTTFCVSCHHAFPLPVPKKATIKLWHAEEAEGAEKDPDRMIISGLTSPHPEGNAQDGGP
jgi:RNA polymerase subunit RPABC4/transcription elongation factor Spt4